MESQTNEANQSIKNKNIIEKIEKIKEIITKDSSLDSNLFSLPEINDYKCIICGNIPNPEIAHEIICCGILFCKDCLMQWIMQNPKCPICKKKIIKDDKYIRSIKDFNKIFYKTLKKFTIKCPYKCDWTGDWEEIEKHLEECEKGYRQCKYKDIGCKYLDEKNKIIEHENSNDKLHLELAMKFIKDNQNNEKIENNVIEIQNNPIQNNMIGSNIIRNPFNNNLTSFILNPRINPPFNSRFQFP